MLLKTHVLKIGRTLAEILPGHVSIANPEDMLDIMADASYNGHEGIVLHAESLHPDFFDLKTRMAGEILQKFSNYRMKMAIIGDFSEYQSKSLRDFIRESNRTGIISFVGSLEEALARLNK